MGGNSASFFASSISNNIQVMSVKVGVRVRPFNKREENLGARLCVQMDGPTTHLLDGEGQKKSFHYDYSFWSHDGFRNDELGYSHPVDDKYADQQKVYNEIGSSILVNAWEGYNCCLFAYGQTGSGKSYSMIGYGANKGLIPIVCESIFGKIHNNQDGTRSFQVKISMMEIYNEAVRDLLGKSGKKVELKICEHKTLGVYVEGLEKHSVDSYEKIQKKIEEGSNNRSMASTLMNESSSRSHTIVSINFVQKIQVSMDQTSVKYSCIHLVDLAGSECVAKTGVDSKDRLRETAKINQSLTTLGRVIEILADNCNKKEKDKTFVPYRDSKLTFILRNALGGNSRTAMICAISPADDNIEETLSTLRYASRAKKIQNRAIVNESDVDKLIRILREQNETLKKMLQEARSSKANINYDMISNFNEMNKNMVEMGIVNMKEEESILSGLEDDANYNEFGKSNSLNQSVSISAPTTKINEALPYLTNISEDQLLSFRIKYSCERVLLIGNKQGNPKPDIVLTTLGIQPNHACITYDPEEKKCFIEALDENSANYTYVNGLNINSKTKEEVVNLDRIIFGTGCVFILMFNGSVPRNENLKLEDIDYQFAFNEMQTTNLDKTNATTLQLEKRIMVEEEELRKKIVVEIEREFEESKRVKEEQMRKQIEDKEREYFEKIREIQAMKSEENNKLLTELENRQKESKILEEEKGRILREVEKHLEERAALSTREAEEKKELQSTRSILEEKLQQIKALEQKMVQLEVITEEKKEEVKIEIKKQQEDMKRELQLQTIICHNENIITEYKLEQNKRMKNAKEVKDLLVKKEKIELQKQLVDLVPQVERFNLMAKEMDKHIECGLSIEYKYISESQTIEVIKNNTYKSKLRILIHVINRDEGRSYYWSTDIFKNRFEHARDMFQNFIKDGKTGKYKEDDPYWDPEKYETIAHTHITLECIMFNISYSGDIVIVSHARKVGKMKVKLMPTDSKGLLDLSIDDRGENNEYKITNPHEQLEKSVYFLLEISNIEIIESQLQFDSMKFEYQLLENYKMVKFSSDIIPRQLVGSYKYRKLHTIKEISENTIIHFMEKPIAIEVQVIQRVAATDELTSRSSFSTVVKSSFSCQLDEEQELKAQSMIENIQISQFQEVSPPRRSMKTLTPPHHQVAHSPLRTPAAGVIFENTDITKKVQEEYQRKKREENQNYPTSTEHVNMKKRKDGANVSVVGDTKDPKKKEKECNIY